MKEYSRLLKDIFESPPVNSDSSSDTQIRSVVCSRDYVLYILAIKSFLRFYQNVEVVVHDDGTLAKREKDALSAHIPGIVIIGKKHADKSMKIMLAKHPHCYHFRSKKVTMLQVFDSNMCYVKNKRILLDADTLFFDYPKEIIEWISQENKKILYAHEEEPYIPTINNRSISRVCGVPFKFSKNLCGGFVCCYSDAFNLKLIEKYCKYVLKHCDDHPGRYYAQGITALCVGMSRYKAEILSDRYQHRPYFERSARPVFRHYWFSCGFPDTYLRDSKIVIKEILQGRPRIPCSG